MNTTSSNTIIVNQSCAENQRNYFYPEINDNGIYSSSSTWVNTSDILNNPAKYHGMIISLGSKYSLISKDKLSQNERNTIKYSLFDGLKDVNIIESIYMNYSFYILIGLPSLDIYKLLEARFLVDGMSLPEIYDPPLIQYEHLGPRESRGFQYYIVTAILPDGTHKSFSQIIRTVN